MEVEAACLSVSKATLNHQSLQLPRGCIHVAPECINQHPTVFVSSQLSFWFNPPINTRLLFPFTGLLHIILTHSTLHSSIPPLPRCMLMLTASKDARCHQCYSHKHLYSCLFVESTNSILDQHF